ncbi:MAG: alkylmercury lyase family protein [Candidatus Limnocylindria bacterium]
MNEDQLPQRVRKFIFDHFVENATPPVVELVMTEFHLSRAEAAEVLQTLEGDRHLALVKGTARILMAFPFSAVATPFRVTVRERQYFANCAWDAIAFHAMLGDDVRVDAFCHHCAAPIQVEMTDGHAARVEPQNALVYLALRPTQWWDNIITTCSNTMVFFASSEHRDASELGAPSQAAASLTPDQVHALSIPIYARKLALDYVRPSKQELLDHFAAMGLTGEYWQL